MNNGTFISHATRESRHGSLAQNPRAPFANGHDYHTGGSAGDQLLKLQFDFQLSWAHHGIDTVKALTEEELMLKHQPVWRTDVLRYAWISAALITAAPLYRAAVQAEPQYQHGDISVMASTAAEPVA